MELEKLQNLYRDFLNSNIKIPGKELVGVKDLISRKKEIYRVYKIKFSQPNVQNLSESDFSFFLTLKGNLSWSNLQRGCKKVTKDMEKLRKALVYLQKEEIPIEIRLSGVAKGGDFYLRGFGKNLITGLLHIFDWTKYGVWNNRSEKVLNKLRRLPYISSNFTNSYLDINNSLQTLARDIGTDLVYLDMFLWWLDYNKHI